MNLFLRKFIGVVLGIVLLTQSIAPYAAFLTPQIARAEEVIPTPTDEVTPTPTVDEITPTATPTPDETSITPTNVPTETATPTPDEISTPTTPDEVTPADTSTPEPTGLSPPAEASQETSTSEKTGNEDLSIVVLENVSAPSLDLGSITESGSASLTTNKPDYAPTDTAFITGSNLLSNTEYVLKIWSDDEPATSSELNVVSSENGSFTYAYQLDGTYRPNYSAELKDSEGTVVASTTFTDSLIPSNKVGISMFGFVISGAYSLPGGQPTGTGEIKNGNVGAYPEGACIPIEIKVKNNDNATGDTVVSPVFDYFNAVVGLDHLEKITTAIPGDPMPTADNLNDFSYPGSDFTLATGFPNSAGGTTTAVIIGPYTGSTAGTGATTATDAQRHYNVTLSSIASGVTVYMTFCAKLGLDASQYNGGSAMSVRSAQGGNENVPIPVNQILQLPSLTLTKVVSGGSATPDQWSFNISPSINGQSNFQIPAGQNSVTVNNISPNGNYAVTESGPSGYSFTSGTGTNCSFNGSTATAAVAAGNPPTNASCTFTNTQQTGSVNAHKLVDTDGNGTYDVNTDAGANALGFNWNLDTVGTNDFGTAVNNVATGSHSVNENSVAGYHFVGWYLTSDTSKTCANTTNTTLPASVSVANGATTNITLCNARNTGTVVVHKDVQGPNGEDITDTSNNFTVQLDNANSETITDNGTVTYNDIPTGSHTVTESVVASNYTLYGISETQGTAGNTGGLQVSVATGATTHVYVTNRQNAGTITVEKEVLDASGESVTDHHAFTVQLNGANDDNTLADNNNVVYNNITPGGPYTVSEVSDTSYDNLGCKLVSGATATDFNVLPGQNVTVTCTNQQKPGSISGYKFESDGVTGILGWTVRLYSCVSSGTDCDTLVDTALTDATGFYSFTNLVVGFYKVVEDLVAGFTPVSATSHNVTINPNTQSEDNNFSNFKNIDITVCKEDTNQNRIPGWEMTLNVDDVASGDAQVTGLDGCYTFSDLGPNHSYSVTEEDRDGWTPVSDPNFTHEFGQPVDGENQSYTFVNVELGTIIVKKVMVGGTGSFDFTGDVAGTISVNNGTLAPNDEVLPGTYTSVEGTEAGWALTNITCDDTTNGGTASTGNVNTRTATFNVDAGETVTCTFTNTKRGNITVVKYNDHNGDGTKDAGDETLGDTGVGAEIEATRWEMHLVGTGVNASQWTGAQVQGQVTFSDLLPNSFTLSEQIKQGWVQTNITCGQEGEDYDAVNDSLSFDFAAGENLTCYVGNQGRGSIRVNKNLDTDGVGGADVFGYTDMFWELDSADHAMGSTVQVAAGSYGISEVQLSNYHFTSLVCKGVNIGSQNTTVEVGVGENVVCTYTNTRDTGTIIVHKIIDPDGVIEGEGATDDQFPGENWEMGADGYDDATDFFTQFTLADGSTTFSPAKTGNYNVREIIGQFDGAYDLVDSYCDNGVGGDSVILTSVGTGDTVHCTFINTPNGTLHGRKWDDENSNQEIDEENLLAGWTINLYKWDDEDEDYTDFVDSFVTDDGDHFGWYWFEHLFPGDYKICEVLKPGWEQTYPAEDGCHYVTLPQGTSGEVLGEQLENRTIGIAYDFGNTESTPVLTISKSNDAAGDKSPNDIVTYTLTVTASEDGGPADNVRVTDLLPKGFVYAPGSWQAFLNNVLNGAITEPTYASPGVWTLGHMDSGDVYKLVYQAKIDGNQPSGTYYDNAWAQGTAVDSSDNIFATAINPGDLDPSLDPSLFVGTQVTIVNPAYRGGEYESTKEVLGASILPATGENTLWAMIATLLSLIGVASMLTGLKMKRGKKHE